MTKNENFVELIFNFYHVTYDWRKCFKKLMFYAVIQQLEHYTRSNFGIFLHSINMLANLSFMLSIFLINGNLITILYK